MESVLASCTQAPRYITVCRSKEAKGKRGALGLVTLSSEEQLMLLLGRSICPSTEYGFTCHISWCLK